MTAAKLPTILLPVLLWCGIAAQVAESANVTATIRLDDSEYTIPIACSDTSSPDFELFTEPRRITRERTGRASSVRLTIRPWKETTGVIVNLDRYVARIPMLSITDDILEI